MPRRQPAQRSMRPLLPLLLAQRVAALRHAGPGPEGNGSLALMRQDTSELRREFTEHLKAAKLYSLTNSSGGTAVVTYAGVDKQQYIDGACVLARAVANVLPDVERWCVVQGTMAESSKEQLRRAGWNLKEVEPWLPENWITVHDGYWRDEYNKVDIFRLPLKRVLYLDADTYIFGKISDIERFIGGELDKGKIRMIKDVNGRNFNGGVFVFSPDMEIFRSIHEFMATGALDQPAINQVYGVENIVEFPERYNLHGGGKRKHNCNDVVIAHFTGLQKPSLADAFNMKRVKDGSYAIEGNSALTCPELYVRYFKKLHEHIDYLSPELRELLMRPDFTASSAGVVKRPPVVIKPRPTPTPEQRRWMQERAREWRRKRAEDTEAMKKAAAAKYHGS